MKISNLKFQIHQGGFTRSEFLGVLAIVALVVGAMIFNFQTSKSKARNEQRKANARSIVYGVQAYQHDLGIFPPSKKGKILACGQPDNLRPCEYGKDKLLALRDPSHSPYIDTIPYDPSDGDGISFYYISDGTDFQIFAHLEGTDDPEWNDYANSLHLPCGQAVCNYGITVGAKTVKKVLEVRE